MENNLEYLTSLAAFSLTRQPVFIVFWFILGLAGLSDLVAEVDDGDADSFDAPAPDC